MIRSKLGMRATYRVGSTLKYRCERGFILEKEDGSDARVMTRRCTTSATWDVGLKKECRELSANRTRSKMNIFIEIRS